MTIYSKIVKSFNSDAPVFCTGRFNPLTQQQLNKAICHLLKQKGVSQLNYASHGFRIGVATTAVAAGLPAWLLKTFGQWNSNAYMKYIRCPNIVLSTVPHILATVDTTHQPPWGPDS